MNNISIQTEKKNYYLNFVDFSRVQEKDVFCKFVEWYVLPKDLREPKTQGQFAVMYGVNIDTLTDWKKRDGFEKEITYNRKLFFREYTSDVCYALVKRAIEGNVSAVKLFLQLFENKNITYN